jgi:phosphoribosylformylglycinamidine synthase
MTQYSKKRFGVIVFPGTWSDQDCHYALGGVLGQEVRYIWHKESDLSGYDCIVLPGGFSYGDYLRPGAIARFSPVMEALERFAREGGLVLGICNGFQVLCEAGLLPGALIRNNHLQYRCQWTYLRVENTFSPFTSACYKGQLLRIPISHYEGSYFADEETLRQLEQNNQIAFRYATAQGEITADANPNGSLNNIAGIINKAGNVLGMMPHPERCCEAILGGVDGRLIFESLLSAGV